MQRVKDRVLYEQYSCSDVTTTGDSATVIYTGEVKLGSVTNEHHEKTQFQRIEHKPYATERDV